MHRPLPWQAIPFLRILPAFASGILSGSLWIGSSRILPVMIPLLFGCMLLLEKWHPISLLKKMGMQGIGMILLLYLTGSYIATKKYGSIHARAELERHSIFDAIIKEAPSGKKKWKATTLLVVNQHCNGQIIPLHEVILAHIDTVNALQLDQGCRIRFRKKLTSMDRLANPGSFDWNRYWQQKNIYYQVYLSDADSIEILDTSAPIIQSILSECRKWVITHLQKNIPDSITAGLAEALLIGFKEDLDRHLRRHYSDTGLMHVIAISGMHLGLIYAVLIALLRLLPFPGRMQTVKTVIALPVLWTFSFLTGAGPSIIRSAVMYSLMTFSIVLNKKNSAVNSLLGSAFLLLSVEPAWIYDVGFQLSYCAVLSILLFYQPIRRWHYARRRIWRLGWDLIAVTLSAQILTLPLCIYHFHQFPVYFLPANLVVVPLSSIVLMGELALCALFFSPLLSKVLGNVLHHIIKIMNGCVEAISGWPGAVWQPLHIDEWQTILLYLFVAGVSLTIVYRHKSGLIFAAMMLAFFLLIRWQSFHEAYKQHAIIIYDAGKASAMDILQGRKSVSFTEADTSAEERIRMIRTKKHALSRVSNIQNIALNKNENMIIRWNKMNILILAGHGVTTNTLPLHSMDLLWVRENAPLPEKETFYKWKAKSVILDGSNAARQAIRWEEFCSAFNTPSHRIVEKGPFVMKIAYPTFAPSEKKFCTLFH